MLIDEVWNGSAFEPSDIAFSNSSGTALLDAELSGTGELIADEYTLTVSARSGGTGTITVSTSSPNNPYDGKVVTLVPFDDATPVYNIVPGATLIFDNVGVNGNVAVVEVGLFLGTFDANAVGAGTPSDGVRHRVTNDGTDTVTDAAARLVTQAVHVRKTGQALGYVSPFAEAATEKTAGGLSSRVMPYALSISGTAGVDEDKTANLSIDGVLIGAGLITDLSNGDAVSGTGLKAVSPLHRYLINSGPLESVEFALDPACANGDVANVLIFPSRFIQIAPDESGVEGDYGVEDVPLTEDGQSEGNITSEGEAFYWVRTLVPAGANAESNPYPMSVLLQGAETGDAGWFA